MPKAVKVKPKGAFIGRLIAESPAKTVERFANDSGIAEKLVYKAVNSELSTPSAIWRIANHLNKNFGAVTYDDLVEPPDFDQKEGDGLSQFTMVLTCSLHLIGDLSRLHGINPVVIQKEFEAVLSRHVTGEMAFAIKELLSGSIIVNADINDATLDALLMLFFRRRLAWLGVTAIRVYSVIDFQERLLKIAAAERVQIGDSIDNIGDWEVIHAHCEKYIYSYGDVYHIGVGFIPPEIVWEIETSLSPSEINYALRQLHMLADSGSPIPPANIDQQLPQTRELPFDAPVKKDI